VEIRYTLAFEDYAEANRLLLLNTTLRRKVSYYLFVRFGLWYGIPLLGLAAAGFLVILYAPGYAMNELVGSAVAIAAWAGAIGIISQVAYRMKLKRLYKEQKLAREISLRADEGGVFVARIDGTSETRFAWPAFDKAVESEQAFVLFPSLRMFLPVPKRAMTPEQQQEFRALLAAHLPGAGVPVAAVS
jgi:hypothetical protein